MTNSRPNINGIIASLSAPQIPPPWSIIETTNTISVLLITVLLISSTVTTIITGNPSAPSPSELLFGWMIGNLLTIVFILIRQRRTPENFAAMCLGHYATTRSLILLLGFGMGITVHLIAGSATAQLLPITQLIDSGNNELHEWIVAGLMIILVQPIAEELVFRGILLPKTRSSINPWGGLLVTTFVYAMFRYLVYGTQLQPTLVLWYGFITPLLMGFFLAIVRIYTNSTRSSIVAHVGASLFWFLSAIVLSN